MDQALKDAEGRELHLVDGYTLEEGVLLVHGAPLLRFDEPQRVEPGLLDAIASGMPGAVVREPERRQVR